MTVRIGVDCVTAVAAEIKSLGADFVCRYLSDFPAKNLNKLEASVLGQAELDIVSNWENDTTDWEGGFALGVDYATKAKAQHLACGGPADRPVYFSVDMDVDPADPRLGEYFRGINSILGADRTGCYGSTAVLRALKSAGRIKWTWRSMSLGFRGGAGGDAEFNMEQTGNLGSRYDRDAAFTADFGQWRPVVTPFPAPPQPAPVVVVHPAPPHTTPQWRAQHNSYTPITVDGAFGPSTVKALQYILGVAVDGTWGPASRKALQSLLGVPVDGVVGPVTIEALQRRVSSAPDGLWGMTTTLKLQGALNAGSLH